MPFWQEVYHTERRAGAIVAAFTPMVQDPLVREAVALQGVEETRHAQLLRVMIDRYGLDATEQPIEQFPAKSGDGVHRFRVRRMHGQLPGLRRFQDCAPVGILARPAMFEIFDVLMHEETRHIVFFHQLHGMAGGAAGTWRRTAARVDVRLVLWPCAQPSAGHGHRGKDSNDGKDFAITEANMFLEGFSFRQFVEDCYRENARRMRAFDPDLLQPRLLPAVANMAFAGLRAWERRRPHLRRRA